VRFSLTRVVQWCNAGHGRMMNLDAVTLSQNVTFSLSVLVVQHAAAHTVSFYGHAHAVINESDAVEQTANDAHQGTAHATIIMGFNSTGGRGHSRWYCGATLPKGSAQYSFPGAHGPFRHGLANATAPTASARCSMVLP
jgi:hypothetical protein